MSLNVRIVSNLASLSPQLRKAARFVADHPEEVATRSLRYLAGEIALTPTTFSRMAAALGYESYEDLREACREQIKAQRKQFSKRANALQQVSLDRSEKGALVVRQGAAVIGNIEALINSISTEDLEQASDKLLGARRVILVGAMSSRPFVDYLAYMASMAFDNWQVLGSKVRSTAAELVDVDERDVAIVLCKAPFARKSVEIASILKDKGCWTIGITDEALSPLHAICTTLFVVSTETPQFFSSHAATLVLIESLIGAIVAKSGEKVSRRIALVESASHEGGEYFKPVS